ncbi:hypothetical protein MC7420_4104 [Coleofasciculus chthonoplastes PCC 7420]|uniref:Uncharacterized protein n=1 Tax=Coleofasciculus chthonoplastes PCC 7420 TaxID=118168 RepID=B4VVC9_9CYAN|nr:hypothetical protein [Coleofasciculus chthonoplastes]EDX74119.1 hypothetical protein MC7420_4104 [Coleofasciculus chthonoplastes PCC 7420]
MNEPKTKKTKKTKKKRIFRQSKKLQELIVILLQDSPMSWLALLRKVRQTAPYWSRKLKPDSPTVKFNVEALLQKGIITQDDQGVYHATKTW